MTKKKQNKILLATLSLAVATPAIVVPVTSNVEASTYSKTFKDVPQSHWASTAIYQAATQQFITGYPDGTFRPSNQVTRAEFATFLSRALDGSVSTTNSFSDVPSSFWASSAINEGISLGFIDPDDYGQKFEPNKPMTRAEIAKWLAKGLASVNADYQKAIDELANSEKTLIPIPETYKGGVNKADLPYIGVAMGTKLLTGYQDFTFKPSGKTTRAEVAAILIRYLDVMKKEPSSFNDLNEFREVASTGTNIFSVTNYQYMGTGANEKGFEDVLGKPYTYSNLGVGAIERVIFVDTTGSSAKGAYSKMFFDGNKRVLNRNRYRTFIEYSFTTQKEISYDQWLNSYSVGYFTGMFASEILASKYGYRTPSVLKNEVVAKGSFFKVGQKNIFWGESSAGNAVGERLTGTTNGVPSSSYGYIIR